mmetsp:Transcript_10537/g.29775  ORF Transcript_10537/g.29775 Transcript_10537/m.29775 type:complete len:201 (-) Transcript_10537:977-1579(-)
MGDANHGILSRVHFLHTDSFQFHCDGVRATQALHCRRICIRKELVTDLEREGEFLATHVPRSSALGGERHALPVQLGPKSIPGVNLGSPSFQRVVPRLGFEAVDVSVHGGNQQVHVPIVVQVLVQDHAVGRFADVHDVGAPGGSIDEVQEAIERHSHHMKLPVLSRVVELRQKDGAHDHGVCLVAQRDPPRSSVQHKDGA